MQKRHTNRERYFEEQAQTTRNYYIPYIKEYTGNLPNKVLEVGCGEGGNLLPFAELGCDVIGIDIAASRIEQAQNFFITKRQKGTFIASDIFLLKVRPPIRFADRTVITKESHERTCCQRRQREP